MGRVQRYPSSPCCPFAKGIRRSNWQPQIKELPRSPTLRKHCIDQYRYAQPILRGPTHSARDHHTLLHHQHRLLRSPDVLQHVPRHRHEVGELARFQRPGSPSIPSNFADPWLLVSNAAEGDMRRSSISMMSL